MAPLYDCIFMLIKLLYNYTFLLINLFISPIVILLIQPKKLLSSSPIVKLELENYKIICI